MKKVSAPATRKSAGVKITQSKNPEGGPRELSWPCECCGKLQLYESPFSCCPTCSQSLARGY